MIDRCRAIADRRGAGVVVLTFDPSPVAVLAPESEPPRLCTTERRVARLREAGADRVVVLRADRGLLAKSPEQFIGGLVEEHGPVAFVEGPDFRFGKGRAGDMDWLAAYGRERGFTTEVVEPTAAVLHDLHRVTVSSSLCRWLVGRGRVADAGRCLVGPVVLEGTVAKGEQRGRTIGVPTVNLAPEDYAGFIVPSDGVYAGWGELSGQGRRYPAAISVGVKPTFGRRQLTVEAHLIGYDGPEVYGRPVTLGFARWLRDQYPFPGVEALVDQLRRDIGQADALWSAASTVA